MDSLDFSASDSAKAFRVVVLKVVVVTTSVVVWVGLGVLLVVLWVREIVDVLGRGLGTRWVTVVSTVPTCGSIRRWLVHSMSR